MKHSFPPNKKSSTCVHIIPINLISKCHVDTAGLDLCDFAPKFISSFFNIYVPQQGLFLKLKASFGRDLKGHFFSL